MIEIIQLLHKISQSIVNRILWDMMASPIVSLTYRIKRRYISKSFIFNLRLNYNYS